MGTVDIHSCIMCGQKIVLGLVALLAFSAVISVSEACRAGGGGGAGGGNGGHGFRIRADRSVDRDGGYDIFVDIDPSYQRGGYDAPGK